MYRLPDDLNRNFTQILISKNLQNQINIFAQSGFAIIEIFATNTITIHLCQPAYPYF